MSPKKCFSVKEESSENEDDSQLAEEDGELSCEDRMKNLDEVEAAINN